MTIRRALRIIAHRDFAIAAEFAIGFALLVCSVSATRAAAPADLSIRATARTFAVGAIGMYKVTVFNRGPSTTDDVITITDMLPPGLHFVSNTGAWICAVSDGVLSCTTDEPLPLGSTTFALFMNVDSDALPRVTNVLMVRYAGDTNFVNNSITKYTSVRPPRGTPTATPAVPSGTPVATPTRTYTPAPAATDLKLVKTLSGIFVVGNNGTYILTVSNIGKLATDSEITVVDTLPASLGFVSANGSGWSCSAAGQRVTCVRTAALPPSASTSIALTVSISSAAAPTVTNSATVLYANDTNPSNNTGYRPTTVRTS